MAHHTEVFDGRHEWPPSAVAIEALEWMELLAMKTGKHQRDADLIEGIWQRKLKQARALEESKQTYDAYQIYGALSDSFKGLRDIAEVENKLNQLGDNAKVKTAIRDEQQQIRKQGEIGARINSLIAARERSSEDVGRDRVNTSDGENQETRLNGMLEDLQKHAGLTEHSGERRVE